MNKKHQLFIVLYFFSAAIFAQDSFKIAVKYSLKAKLVLLKEAVQQGTVKDREAIILSNNDTIITAKNKLKDIFSTKIQKGLK